jgi:hypothetical protein
MYSQQYMTEYASPYRFPPLEQPKPRSATLKGDAVAEATTAQTPMRLAAAGPAKAKVGASRPQSRPEPMSSRIKRKYGLQ